jgi:uncharacterized membrane protein YdbT with pleckstrin-like domain
MLKRQFFIIMFLSIVLIGFIGCGETKKESSEQPVKEEAADTETTETTETAAEPAQTGETAQEAQETQEAQTEEAATTEESASEVRGSYTLQLGPNETKSVTETFTGFILGTGLAKANVKIQFVDITDPSNPKVIRSATISFGANFTLRSNFSGTKTIRVDVTNLKSEAGSVNLTLQ